MDPIILTCGEHRLHTSIDRLTRMMLPDCRRGDTLVIRPIAPADVPAQVGRYVLLLIRRDWDTPLPYLIHSVDPDGEINLATADSYGRAEQSTTVAHIITAAVIEQVIRPQRRPKATTRPTPAITPALVAA